MDDTALVKVNLDFSNKRTKFKITATLQKESPQEVKYTFTTKTNYVLIKINFISGRAHNHSS